MPRAWRRVISLHGMLRDQDDVGAARDSAHHRDPSGVAAHHLDDHHAVVRLGGRVQPVNRLRTDEDCGVEAEGVVRPRKVVVDRLRHADDVKIVLFIQPGRHAERVLAADRDEGVEAVLLERAKDGFDTAVELVRIRPRRADDRAAARKDPGHLAWPQVLQLVFDEPAPAFADADHVPAAGVQPARHGPDDRVQPRAVTAPGQDPRAHAAILERPSP